jgi:RimJ/RimL family protein N-acetyltransferase
VRPPQPALSDGTIRLDAFSLADLDAHLAGEDDDQRRWFELPRASTVETVRAAIERWTAGWRDDGNLLAYAIRDARTGVLMGGCELRFEGDRAQCSYWIFAPFRRRGVASAGLGLLCRFAARDLGMTEVEARVDPQNAASRRTAEKAGFVDSGTLRETTGALRVRYRWTVY